MIRLIITLLFFSIAIQTVSAQDGWQKDNIRNLMNKTAQWQMQQPAKYPKLDWHEGTWYAGLMALYDTTRDSIYDDYLCNIASSHHWQGMSDVYDADRLMVVQTYLDLFRHQPDSQRIQHSKWMLDAHLARRPKADVQFTDNPYRREWWSWCDALFMAPPAFAKYYRLTGDEKYLDYLTEHWWKTSEYLYAQPENLFYRDDRFFDAKSPNGAKVFWSRGNGWVLAAIARIGSELPSDFNGRPRFEKQFVEMAASIRARQGADGLWRANLLDYDAFPEPECSSTALFCYAFAWGIRTGLLDADTYLPVVKKAWAGLSSHINAEGRLGFVQPPGIEPKAFSEENWESYGTGAFLLAGCEIIRLLEESGPAVTYEKGELLYENTLSDPAAVRGWVMEGPGKLEFKNGWMELYAEQQQWHHVFWCPQTFPGSFIAEWEVQNLHTEAGLLITFFAAAGRNGEDLFDSALPPREGTFKYYTKDQINSYHISYYANNPKNPTREFAHLRKNSGFALVQTGPEGIPKTSPAVHHIKLVKDLGRICFFIDGRKIIDWTDDGNTQGPVLGAGKIGFRQMQWSHFRYRNFRVWQLTHQNRTSHDS
ncbi:DUF1961 family protein [Parapedobacter indicus]|uniref:Rhamnogalacturonyl hydrolase YesR n=1 Tax=Parapedobacter indicus TaxID=1477437 RepID=A0A1I3K0M5_9SPHI|nr:DUF1961 family protein [Parapedobacter indicus]PPL01675.1 rhamnogalacturonyl hydrolase YesR [Parapedobacter indicus]SFI66042.1 Rhamnogalacturonyl hydrolase YesR [Parapedobacter indicus]